MLERFRDLHSIGYLHLDLKPDNILLGSSNWTKLESSVIVLIDYGISKKYVNESGLHIKANTNVPFAGNLLFASKNAFL